MRDSAMGIDTCPICSHDDLRVVLRSPIAYFTNGVSSLEDYQVAVCGACGFAFQRSAYRPDYTDALGNLYNEYGLSWQFSFPRRDRKTLDSLEFVLSNVQLGSHSRVLEIGSDRGDFLHLIRERTNAEILGLEPTRNDSAKVPTRYGDAFAVDVEGPYDLVVMKHTLEHIPDPKRVVDLLNRLVGESGAVYLEVPSFDRVRENFLEDCIPDHVSHFSKADIQFLFADWQPLAWDDTHFLRAIFAHPSHATVGAAHSPVDVEELLRYFSIYAQKVEEVRRSIVDWSNSGRPIVFFGAGLYFRALFAILRDRLNSSCCFFLDDSVTVDVEPAFGLRKADVSRLRNEPVLVIGCSNDVVAQDMMCLAARKLFDKMGFVHLYRGFETQESLP